MTPNEACKKALEFMKTRVHGLGGIIALDTKGRVGIQFTTENMSWAQIGGQDGESQVKYGCDLVNVYTNPF